MSQQPEVRRMPKKTIYIIIGMCIVATAFFFLIKTSKEMKMEEVLTTLGHPNTTDITVYNESGVKDEKTNKKGKLYKISFKDLNTNQECYGLVFKDHKRKYTKDFTCK